MEESSRKRFNMIVCVMLAVFGSQCKLCTVHRRRVIRVEELCIAPIGPRIDHYYQHKHILGGNNNGHNNFSIPRQGRLLARSRSLLLIRQSTPPIHHLSVLHALHPWVSPTDQSLPWRFSLPSLVQSPLVMLPTRHRSYQTASAQKRQEPPRPLPESVCVIGSTR